MDPICVIDCSPRLLDRIRNAGIQALFVNKRSQDGIDALVIDYSDERILFPAVDRAFAQTKFVSCITQKDSALPTAAKINERFELRGLSPGIVHRTVDKHAMRKSLEGETYSQVRYALVPKNGSLGPAADSVGFPLIAKPRYGTASVGVCLANSIEELESFFPKTPRPSYVIEEYMTGDIYTVDTLSVDGNICFHCILQLINGDPTVVRDFVEREVRGPVRLHGDVEREIMKSVDHLLRRLGITYGPAHTEILITEKGVRIIETQPRIGGGAIPEMIQLTTGVDMREAIVRQAASALAEPPCAKPQSGAYSWRYLDSPPGKIRSIWGHYIVREWPEIRRIELWVQPGSQVKPIESPNDLLGYLIAQGSNLEEASLLSRSAADKIHFILSEER